MRKQSIPGPLFEEERPGIEASWDFAQGDSDPTPTTYSGDEPDSHGTSCGGEIAMAKDNNQCGVGVAFNSNLGCKSILKLI